MGLDVDARHLAEKGLSERFDRGSFLLLVEAESGEHRSVNALDSEVPHHEMQGRNVTESDDPFGVFAQRRKIDERKQSYRTVSAASGQNCLNRGVVDHALEVFGTLPVRRGEVGLFAAVPESAEFRVQPPGLESCTDLCRVDLLGEFPGRGDDSYGVAAVEIGRSDEFGRIEDLGCSTERGEP